ncbi:hypothetical protein [Morganella morganii]|uniref:hypothetical protein n=1 Tax=Morganella morganii TaxID=582 RepID=UPI002368BEB1|nr:hypothetical protein [Morganella morganii]
MKEHGIIFNSEMVRAILDGRKTQTRRIIKAVPTTHDFHGWIMSSTCTKNEGKACWAIGNSPLLKDPIRLNCPLGKIGDRLWVRETYSLLGNEDACPIDWNDDIVNDKTEAARIYRASCEQKPGNYGLWSIPDDADWKPRTKNMEFEGSWTPSIHMHRWASRILLEITDVRVDRLQDISEEDAVAEGVVTGSYGNEGNWMKGFYAPGGNQPHQTEKSAYSELWCSIYGVDAWYKNPWVWVIEFRRVKK